jgi:acetylglutamate kinase
MEDPELPRPAGGRRVHADRRDAAVVVHGGGKAITVAMEKAGLTARPVQGRRYTDEDTLEIVARPGRGDQSRHRAAHQQVRRTRLACTTRRPCSVSTAASRAARRSGERVDLGLVGEVTEVDTP